MRVWILVALVAWGLCGSVALAEEAPEGSADVAPVESETLQRLTVLVENDKFAGTDQFYTNGLKLAYQRSDVGFLSEAVSSAINTVFPFLEARPLSWGLVFGQNIYTPRDVEETRLIPGDRPYGAWLYGGLSLTRGNALEADEDEALFQDRIVLLGGVIGRSALGEQVQNNFHRLINVSTSKGWSNQLRTETGVQLYLQRKWLLRVWGRADDSWGPGADFLPHFGLAVGNVFTHTSIGGTFRFGLNLGDDFGPAQRIASAGLDALLPPHGLRVYVFGRIEGRGVLFNAFLDGNLMRELPRRPSTRGQIEAVDIDRERFVADFEAGIVIEAAWISVSLTSVTRTREFRQQKDSFTFGAIHVSLTW